MNRTIGKALLGVFATLAIALALAAQTPATVGTGPYPALSEPIANLPTHTLYRPRDLAEDGGVEVRTGWQSHPSCAQAATQLCRLF